MIGTLIGILLAIVIIGVIWWAVQQLLPLIPLPEPFRRIVYVLMILILVLIVIWIIVVLLAAAGINVPRPFRLSMPLGSTTASVSAHAGYL